MKAVIIAFGNIRVTPYIDTYISIIKKYQDMPYDVIYWNRQGIEETLECNRLYGYTAHLQDDENKLRKFFYMEKYAVYVKKILKKNRYDKIIVLNPLMGIMLKGFLLRHASGKYILDIRDHSYEQIRWYYRQMEQLMKYSLLNVISSNGFKNFLPPEKTILVHNFNTVPESEQVVNIRSGKEISIVFMGNIRYADAYTYFLLNIKDQKRIRFEFWGFGEEEAFLKDFCKTNQITNVYFQGAYHPEQKRNLIEKADILFNVYGTDLHVKYAISNKYYDAVFFEKPIIVNKGTSMASEAAGLAFEVDEDFHSENLLEWYDSIDALRFDEICRQKQKKVIEDNQIFRDEVSRKLRCNGGDA